MNNDQYSQIINWQLGSICCRVLRLGSSTGGLGLCQLLPPGHSVQSSPRSGKLLRTDFRFAPSLPQRPGQQQLRHSAPPSNKPHLAEKISGLASNLAHLGRIC